MSDGGAAGGADSVGGVDSGSGAADASAVGAGDFGGGVDASQAASFAASVEVAQAATNTTANIAATDRQVGYGDKPGGVAVRDLDDLTKEDVAAKIDAHLKAYDPPQNRAPLKDALDLAVAYKAQGGIVDFDSIRNNPKLDGRSQAEVTVAEKYANTLAVASGNIRALNRESINYGAELYETLRTIDNAQQGPMLIGDPKDRMAFGLIVDQQMARIHHLSGVDIVKDAAFQDVMKAAGYGDLFAEARQVINLINEGKISGSRPGSRPGWVRPSDPDQQIPGLSPFGL